MRAQHQEQAAHSKNHDKVTTEHVSSG